MKKIWAILIALVMMFSLVACGENGQEVENNSNQDSQQQELDSKSTQGDVSEVPDEFWVKAGDDQIYENLIFEHDITITIDTAATMEKRAQILFAGCTFNGDIKVVGDLSGFLRFVEGCVFAEDCAVTVVEATEGLKDKATIEDDLVKLLFEDRSPVINADTICNVFCYNGEGVIVDGVEYKKEEFPENESFCVATYFENGEKSVFTAGIDE